MDEVQKTIQGARAARNEHLRNGFSNIKEVSANEDDFAKSDSETAPLENKEAVEETEKSETDEMASKDEATEEVFEENPFNKAVEEAPEDNVEKSDIMHALSEGSVKISKTGKEIKAQVDGILLPEINSELAVKKNKADEKLKECGLAPTKTPDEWWTNGLKLDCGYKVYDWCETYIPEKRIAMDTLSAEDAKSKETNVPENQAQADSRRVYNDTVRGICEILVDLKACEILKNLKDETKYELTPRQVITFRF